ARFRRRGAVRLSPRERREPQFARDRLVSLRPDRRYGPRQRARQLRGPERSGRLVRRLQYVAELAGDGLADVRTRSIHDDARNPLRRLGVAQRGTLREPAWTPEQYAAVLDDDQQRRRSLLPRVV